LWALLSQIGMVLIRLIRVGLICLQGVWTTSEVSEYETWRQRFLYHRLKLAMHLALLIGLVFTGLDFYTVGFQIDRKVIFDSSILLCLYTCLRLHQTAFGRTHLKLLFLGFYGSITLIPGIRHLLESISDPNLTLWTPAFLFSALFVPVYWSLHLLAQLGTLAFYFIFCIVAKLWLVASPDKLGMISPFNQLLSVFWVCFICDFSVYLYEQFQQNEVETRQASGWDANAALPDRSRLNRPDTSRSTDVPPSASLPQKADWLSGCDRALHQFNTCLEAYIRETSKIRLREKPVRLNQVVQGAILRLEALLLERQTLLTNTLPELLPIVRADAKKVRQVLEILITDLLTHSSQVQHLTLQAERVTVSDRSAANAEGEKHSSALNVHALRLIIQAESLDMGTDISLPYSTSAKPIAASDWHSKLHWCEQVIAAHGSLLLTDHTPTRRIFRFTLPLMADSQMLRNLSIVGDS
jgi:hypothetical protein